ncbi:MAG TPA: hypothetical protein DEB71_12325 [Chryseobacterium carnipullorum]|nr:hypothetical protein [Chryseobacterium carnipullorum]
MIISLIYFLLICFASAFLQAIFFYFQNKKIITKYKQPDSRELKKIRGKIVTEKGLLRKNIR